MKVFFSPSCLALHLPGSCSCTALWVPLLHFLPINPIYICLYFFIPPLFPVGFFSFFCLKAGTPRRAAHHVWMCSDTLSSQGLISSGKIGVWHVYILFPCRCRIKKQTKQRQKKRKKPSFLFHGALQTRRFTEGKQMLTRLLNPKRKEKDLCEQTKTRIAWGDSRKPSPPTGVYGPHRVCLRVFLFDWFLFIGVLSFSR